MNSEGNKAVVRRWIEEMLGMGKFELIPALSTPDYTYASAQDPLMGIEGYRALIAQIRSAFPDLRNTLEEQIAEGDTVVTRGTSTGTHRAAFMGVPATGKFVTVPWLIVSHLSDGRIVRDFEIYDALGLMQQIGAIPALA